MAKRGVRFVTHRPSAEDRVCQVSRARTTIARPRRRSWPLSDTPRHIWPGVDPVVSRVAPSACLVRNSELHSNHDGHALHHRLSGRKPRTGGRFAFGRRRVRAGRHTRNANVEASRIPTEGVGLGTRRRGNPLHVGPRPGSAQAAPGNGGRRLGRVLGWLSPAPLTRPGRARATRPAHRRRERLPPLFRGRPRGVPPVASRP